VAKVSQGLWGVYSYIISQLVQLVNSRGPGHSKECPPCPTQQVRISYKNTLPLVYTPLPSTGLKRIGKGGGVMYLYGIAPIANAQKNTPDWGKSEDRV
jgi:hypothetical protein